MIYIFLGPPGSGKGTQAKRIEEKFGVLQVSTGDILRSAIKEASPLGREAKSFVDSGGLVPDDIVVALIKEICEQDKFKNGFILDGFPRTIPQAEALDLMLGKINKKIENVILFVVAEDVLLSRISGRRTCLQCGRMYHIESNRPKVEDTCDQCSNRLVQREDDKIEVIKNRLKVYREQTAPLIGYYEKRKIMGRVDAGNVPPAVASELNVLMKFV